MRRWPKTTAAANDDSNLSGDFFTTESNSLGVVYHAYDTSADNISAVVTSGTVVAMEIEADSLTPYDHWILVVEKAPTAPSPFMTPPQAT